MITSILLYFLFSILILAFSWFMGYVLLKHFGYKIVEIEKDDCTEDTAGQDGE